MVFDPSSPSSQSSPGQIRFYVADTVNLWGTQNQGTSFTSLTSNLPAGFTRPTAVEFISNNGVNALLVGGLNVPLACDSSPNGCVISSRQSPITVADSDANGNLSGWRAFGQGLPNAWIAQLAYYPAVDVLVAGAVGRGVFTLYDVTSYFPQATVLQFGLANNDSLPDASFLTDGTTLTGTSFSRPLNKYGTGGASGRSHEQHQLSRLVPLLEFCIGAKRGGFLDRTARSSLRYWARRQCSSARSR
jgi:hypothetical protein